MNSDRPQPDRDPLTVLLAAAVVGVVLFAVLVFLWYVRNFGEAVWPKDRGTWGQFGDYFGGMVNPMVGLVTVFLVFLSITIQRREFKDTNRALAKQNAAIALQSYEQTFFAWLSNYRDSVSSVTYNDRTGRGRDLTGRDALRVLWAEHLGREAFQKHAGRVMKKNHFDEWRRSGCIAQEAVDTMFAKLLEEWQEVYRTSEHHVDSMLRTLYRLVRWVDEQPESLLPPSQKWHYISIVRAQLSRVEMIYLFYNGFTDRGQQFSHYISKYALFADLDDNEDFGLFPFMRELRISPFEAEAFDSDLALRKLMI